MKIKNVSMMFIVVFSTWALLNSSLDPIVLGIGAVVALFVAIAMCDECAFFTDMKLNPKAIAYMFIYVFVFLFELLKANFHVAKIVISPTIAINPGIVEVKTKLTSKAGRLLLANSITLTPGTLSVDIKDDSLFIHWVDVTSKDAEGATKEIVTSFEKYLEVIYG